MSLGRTSQKEKEDLFTRLTRIEEGLSLSTFDNTILVLMILLFTVGLSFLSLENVFKNSPLLFVGFILLFVIAGLLIVYILGYVQSIFYKKRSFTTKVNVIAALTGSITLVGLTWLFFLIAGILEKWWVIPENIARIIGGVIILGTIIFAWFYIRPKLEEYINNEFPEILKKRKEDLGIK